MVTSNKLPEKKVVKMVDSNNAAVVPQRTLLGEVNEHITCPLCRGYYIDATTIVECLHSFCRSCIIKHLKVKSYCPVCEMMINSAKPNIKLDKALQDIVYKLVPGLFQKEMERRQHFYSSRPGPAASATPEQRGEDTERIIFSPEDVISFSLEYADVTDSDSISSKSSDSNELPSAPATTRRYLQCPAVVNISHLKKFLCMKFDIDCTQFAIDILYKRVPLPDYYTLMDIAYIYNWKRNEPMRFFYQIIDYVAIRNRMFEIRKSSHFQENKTSSASTDDANINSPVPQIDQGSEASSGTDSPMPEDNHTKHTANNKKFDKDKSQEHSENLDQSKGSTKKTEDEVEKSQFLNSFELAPKSNASKTSPSKSNTTDDSAFINAPKSITQTNVPKPEETVATDTLKRKSQMLSNTPELKKLKIELEKTKLTNYTSSLTGSSSTSSSNTKVKDSPPKPKETEMTSKTFQANPNTGSNINISSPSSIPIESKHQQTISAPANNADNLGTKRSVSQHVASTKRKPSEIPSPSPHQSATQQTAPQKTISPLKIQVPKLEIPKIPDASKPPVKKIPDLKPSTPSSQNKGPPVKVRMDLLANNSDPTIDRTKILSQVKTSLGSPNIATTSGDPLKSLFDSCKINIPSSLSITLTDQKLDARNPGESVTPDPKKNIVNKNLTGANNSLTHKVPSPPVHNYIEILKLPESEMKKPNKTETGNDTKPNPQNKADTPAIPNKPANKSSESSAKGPIPNLKPISDTKLAKQSANYGGPVTFQQTFEQQIQSLQGDKKSKGPKTKAQVPKLVPVPSTPKNFSAANKPIVSTNKPPSNESKASTALDLSSPHNIQSPSGPPQNLEKAFETMQSIANLAKKQNMPSKGMSPTITPNPSFPSMSSRPMAVGSSPLRVPTTSNMNQIKLDKNSNGNQLNIARQEALKHNSLKLSSSSSPSGTPSYQMPLHASSSNTQPSPRQVRSPSSSPKLVIAEEKHSNNSPLEQNMNQSNQITSTQLAASMASKSESPTSIAGPSKPGLKSLKPIPPPSSKLTTNRQPAAPTMKPNPSNMTPPDYLQPQYMHSAFVRHPMEINGLHWMKQRQQYNFDLLKSIHQSQNDFNKDKQ